MRGHAPVGVALAVTYANAVDNYLYGADMEVENEIEQQSSQIDAGLKTTQTCTTRCRMIEVQRNTADGNMAESDHRKNE